MLYHRPLHFAILSYGRCGSEWLVKRLNSHPDVTCVSELFCLTRNKEGNNPKWVPPDLNTKWSQLVGTMTNQVHGFKVLYAQLRSRKDTDLFLDSVFGRNSANERMVIHLIRRNYLDVLVSHKLVHRHRFHHFTEKQTRAQKDYNSGKILINPNGFKQFVANYEQQQEWADGVFPKAKRFWYEDLQQDGLQSVFDFLSIPPANLSDTYAKMRTKPKSEMIENFDQLVTELRGTQYEWMLDG